MARNVISGSVRCDTASQEMSMLYSYHTYKVPWVVLAHVKISFNNTTHINFIFSFVCSFVILVFVCCLLVMCMGVLYLTLSLVITCVHKIVVVCIV